MITNFAYITPLGTIIPTVVVEDASRYISTFLDLPQDKKSDDVIPIDNFIDDKFAHDAIFNTKKRANLDKQVQKETFLAAQTAY